MGNHLFIEYNRSNKERSRKFRKEMTQAERKMWFDILVSRPAGYKFLRQKLIKSFILDFYCAKLLLCIEIDGSSHDNKEEYDIQRSSCLQEVGIITIRYTNKEIINNIGEVFNNLIARIKEREQQLNTVPGQGERDPLAG